MTAEKHATDNTVTILGLSNSVTGCNCPL